jgi:lipoprotein-anchoring transpeptidase ErfK/SrfK
MNQSILLPLLAITGCTFLVSCGSTQETTSSQPIQYLAGLTPYPTYQMSASNNPQFADAYWDGDSAEGPAKIVIDLSDQKARFYKGGTIVGVTPISSGDATHETPTGNFKVTEKSPDHRSNVYGDYVDDYGNVVKANVDNRKDKRPSGTKYLGSDMQWFLRFNKGIGMHKGYLPGYPASHGCVRQPEFMARHFYDNAELGTPVIVQD